MTSLPGLGAGTAGRPRGGRPALAREPAPAESVRFASAGLAASDPARRRARACGSRLTPADGAATDATLFVQLSAATADTERALPGGVAPLRVRVPASGRHVEVTLPGTAWSFAPGDRLVLAVRTSDAQYSGSTAPAAYGVSLAGPVVLPTVAPVATARTAGLPSAGVLIGIAAALVVAVLLLVLGAPARPPAPA